MSEIKGVEVSDLLGLSQPLTKLIECVSQAIGKVYESKHIKSLAHAKAEEIQIISGALYEI